MAFFSFLYRYGIWISIPAFVLFGVLLVQCIAGVVRSGKQARLFSVPLAGQQPIEFTQAGRVVLSMEGPLLSRRFAGLEYELTGPDGVSVNSRRTIFRARTTGFKKARMELRVYDITTAGRHVFRIKGLEGEKPSDREHAMVFSRPHFGQTVAYIIGIILTSLFTIGSIVLFSLRIAGV